MVHHSHTLLKRLLVIGALLLGLAFSVAVEAEDSTGIRLGTSHFGSSPRPQPNQGGEQPDSRSQSFGVAPKTYHYRDHQSHDSTPRVTRHRYAPDNSTSPKRDYRHDRDGRDRDGRNHHHYPRVIQTSPVYWITPSYYVEPELYAPRSPSSVTRITGNNTSGINYRRSPDEQFAYRDPWAALANYQISEALDVFAWQLDGRPYAALPKVGYALTVALAGDLEQGSIMMDEALSGNVSELLYFRSSEDMNLILEELMLSYRDDAFMTSSLLYLRQHFADAEQAVNQAMADCNGCTSARQLEELIHQQQ